MIETKLITLLTYMFTDPAHDTKGDSDTGDIRKL
jgi:hypothetical protein